MMSLASASLALVLAFVQAAPVPKADFSGRWTIDRSRSESPANVVLEIKHTATEISIETFRGDTTSKRVYPLEPEAHTISAAAVTEGHSHAYCSGTQLVTEVSGEIRGQTVSFKQTRSLNAAGTEMTVESITIVQHGYSLEGGKTYGTAKDVYVRAK